MKTHFTGFAAENDGPGLHGRSLDDDMQSGLERCIGHGRRFLGGEKCHLQGPVPVEHTEIPGLHGHYKGDDFQNGIERYVGHGLKKYDRSTHHRHHISDDIESEPGLHGHTKDFDYKDGMEWYIGHGKRRLQSDHASKLPGAPKGRNASGGYSHCHADYRPAGMPTRNIHLAQMSRDPTRQGTHQDRRGVGGKALRKDQLENPDAGFEI